jgi:hypothetical protein
MSDDLLLRVAKKEMYDRVRYVVNRRQKVAQKLTSHHMSDDEVARIICSMSHYVCTHVGRNAPGTTLLKQCRTKDHKHRKGRRVAATQTTFAHNVDLHRAWCAFRAHFVPGGSVWLTMGRSQKQRTRAAVYEADLHVRTYGDYVGAFNIIRGE